MNIVLLTNILTPYRRFFYDKLHAQLTARGSSFATLVMARTERNRAWRYEEYQTGYTQLLPHTSFALDQADIHINHGLRQSLSERRPDLVVAAGGYLLPAVLEAIWLKKKLGYKLLFWSESHLAEEKGHSPLRKAITEKLRQAVYRQFDGFWYAGQLSRQFIQQYAARQAALFFVPNLVDNRLFAKRLNPAERQAQRAVWGLEDTQFVFLCPARLTRVKGLQAFLPLLGKCRNQQRATVMVPGDGELRQELQAQIAASGLDVRLIGYQDQATVAALYAIADCFLMPSLSDPNPLTCIEALWSGLPLLVSTHVGNHPEVVRPAENGFVFDYRRPEAAIAAIDTLLASDPDWRAAAQQVSRQIAQDIYEPDAAAGRLIDQLTQYATGRG